MRFPSRSRSRGGKQGAGGKRPDLGNRYFRSAWEANYARMLEWVWKHKKIAGWEYEPIEFEFTEIKRGTRFYTPDFRVDETDGSYTYVEIKGWFDPKSLTALKRMAKYYPNVPIKVVGPKAYYLLDEKVQAVVSREQYECYNDIRYTMRRFLLHWEE